MSEAPEPTTPSPGVGLPFSTLSSDLFFISPPPETFLPQLEQNLSLLSISCPQPAQEMSPLTTSVSSDFNEALGREAPQESHLRTLASASNPLPHFGQSFIPFSEEVGLSPSSSPSS